MISVDVPVRLFPSGGLPTSIGNKLLWIATPGTAPVTPPISNAFRAIAIGNEAVASNQDAFAIGSHALASGIYSSALGSGAEASGPSAISIAGGRDGFPATASGNGAVAIGGTVGGSGGPEGARASGNAAIAIGSAIGSGVLRGALASGDYSISLGQYAHALYTSAVTVGHAAYNANHYGVAVGPSVNISGPSGVGIGYGAQVSGSYGIAIGQQPITSTENGVAIGNQCVSSHQNAIALGGYASTENNFSLTHGSDAAGVKRASAHDVVLYQSTTDATPTAMLAPYIACPQGTALGFEGQVIGFRTVAAGTVGDCAMFTIKGLIKNVAGTYTLVGSTVTMLYNDAGAAAWVITLTAVAGGLEIKVTGNAASTIKWGGHVAYPQTW